MVSRQVSGLVVCLAMMSGSLARGQHLESRAGYLGRVAWWAAPSETPAYSGGYIGGGRVFKGEPRFVHEGTWGWDYEGRFLTRRVFLNWGHGRRYQGGTGAYRTDGGPKIPDVPGAINASLNLIRK